jgi:hypothetical protein
MVIFRKSKDIMLNGCTAVVGQNAGNYPYFMYLSRKEIMYRRYT